MAKPKHEQNRRRSLSDPLAAALLPPPNETPVEKERRLNAEQEARKVSEGIDDMIRQERNDKKKAKPEVKVLLLGQSESGKSTTLKRECSFLAFLHVWGIVGYWCIRFEDNCKQSWASIDSPFGYPCESRGFHFSPFTFSTNAYFSLLPWSPALYMQYDASLASFHPNAAHRIVVGFYGIFLPICNLSLNSSEVLKRLTNKTL